jgi:hypothetical protein
MLVVVKPKLPDIIIILLAAGLTVFSAQSAYLKPQETSYVLIQGENHSWTFPLEADETVIVSGPLGDTVVRINGKNAWVESSPCLNQTCVGTGHIRRQGSWAACLPNNVLLIIEGEKTEDDAIVW